MAEKVEETDEISFLEDEIQIESIFQGNHLHCQAEDLLDDLGYGAVHRGVWKGEPVAIRRIDKSHCFPNWKESFDRHFNGTLDSDNVLKVFDFEEDSSCRYFALELFGGTLEQFCNHQYRGSMPSDAQVLYQIAKGVDYLHKRGLAHGRLNPKAILISQSHPVKMKVSDFGLCQFKDCPSDCLTVSSDVKEDLSHPKYWINSRLSRKRKSKGLANSDNTFSTPTATVHGDTFAVGCLFFYFLKKGLHPFGERESILNNISKKKSINLKKLDKTHFAFDSIKKLIQDPPTDGTQHLSIALVKLENVLPLRIDENKFYGRGKFGIVYGGTYEGNPVAVKKISIDVFTSEDELKQMQREVEGHGQMNHENVLKLLHFDDMISSSFRYLILELCAGTLTHYCEKKSEELKLPSDELVLYQIANGLHYIHSRNLVHRDVKPDNILISMTPPTKIKLSDFGLCKKVSHQETFSQSGLKGTMNWMAPEMIEIMNDPENQMEQLPHGTIGSDTFSAGCVFFYFLTRGKHPFGKSHHLLTNILEAKPVELEIFEQNLQKEDSGKLRICHIIKNMICIKEKRIASSDVIEHLTPLLIAHRQFKETERVIPGYDKVACLFNPTKPVLACSVKHEVIFFTAANGFIPFSNWKQSELKLQAENTNKITALQWNSDGNQLAAGDRNGDVIVWSYPAGNILFQMNQHLKDVTTIEWNPSRLDVLATIDRMGKKCLLWNSSPSDSTTNLLWTMEGENDIMCAKWISKNQIALGFRNGVIKIWEINSSLTKASCTATFPVDDPTNSLEDLQWNENIRYLVSRSSQGEVIRIWSTDSEKCIYKTRVFKCSNFAWRPNKKVTDESEVDRRKLPQSFIFACGTADGDVLIWNPLENDEKLRTLTRQHSKPLVLVVFSPDGRFLASADTNNKIIVWSTETWDPVFITRSPSLYSLKFSWLFTTSSTDASGYKFAFYTYGIYGSTVKVIEYAITETNDVQQPSVG